MPVLAALLASLAIHLGVLLAPGLDMMVAESEAEAGESPPLRAVLVKSAAHRTAHGPDSNVVPRVKPRDRVQAPVADSSGDVVVAAEPVPEAVTTPAPVLDAGNVETSLAQAIDAAPAPHVGTADDAASAVSLSLPPEGRMDYAVTRGDSGFLIGRAHHEWAVHGTQYTLRNTLETVGIAALFKSIKVTQSSHGEITAGGLRPREFQMERGKGTEIARFDWLQGKVFNGEREDALPPATQDLLSIYYQLALLQPRSGVLDLAIATGRKLDRYHFDVLGEEVLATSIGDQQTVHVRVKAGTDLMDLWLAPAISPLPLRIRIVNNKGDVYDQTAKFDSATSPP